MTSAVRATVRSKLIEVQAYGILAVGVPGIVAARTLHTRWMGTRWVFAGFWAAYGIISYGSMRFLSDHVRQFTRLQVADLDSYFEQAYAWYFIHADAEGLRGRWHTVRPRVVNILKAASSVATLPCIDSWEIARIDECLEKDVWYLRRLAKLLRGKVGDENKR